MPGNIEGGRKAAAKIKARDPDFYKKIGSIGGRNGAGPEYQLGGIKASGFAANPELASIAGYEGGRKSRRRKRDDSNLERRL